MGLLLLLQFFIKMLGNVACLVILLHNLKKKICEDKGMGEDTAKYSFI
jgi:hypothetical protein